MTDYLKYDKLNVTTRPDLLMAAIDELVSKLREAEARLERNELRDRTSNEGD
jgi:hypothetical protein